MGVQFLESLCYGTLAMSKEKVGVYVLESKIHHDISIYKLGWTPNSEFELGTILLLQN